MSVKAVSKWGYEEFLFPNAHFLGLQACLLMQLCFLSLQYSLASHNIA